MKSPAIRTFSFQRILKLDPAARAPSDRIIPHSTIARRRPSSDVSFRVPGLSISVCLLMRSATSSNSNPHERQNFCSDEASAEQFGQYNRIPRWHASIAYPNLPGLRPLPIPQVELESQIVCFDQLLAAKTVKQSIRNKIEKR